MGDRQAEARSLSNLANAVKLQGDYSRARTLYAECLSIFEELNDRTGVAWSLNDYQGDVVRDQGDSAAARTLYEQSLAIFRELGDPWGIAGTLADLGSLAREQCDCATAKSHYAESIKIFQELGFKRGIARLLECFACAAAVQREAERSRPAGWGSRCPATNDWRSAYIRGASQIGSNPPPSSHVADPNRWLGSLARGYGFAD